MLAIGIAGAVAILMFRKSLQDSLRDRAVALLEERLKSDVELEALDVYMGYVLVIRGRGLVVRHHGRTDVPPLVSVETFAAVVPWSGYFANPRRVTTVELEGLRVTIPPGNTDGRRGRESGGCIDRDAAAAPAFRPRPAPFLIDRVTSRNATLTQIPSRPDKQPRVFDISRVVLDQFAFDRAADYDVTLVNPKPRGDIAARGTFGPFDADQPNGTPVRGSYRFEKADLGAIKGIAGTLESEGRFEGPLRQIAITGFSRVPDFGLTTSSNRLPLDVEFDACVDGTDGDTYLDHVRGTLANSVIVASGRVEGIVGVMGRAVVLDATVDDGRIEDFLRLAVDDASPLMTGLVDIRTGFSLPPGEADVVERLELKGQFDLRGGQFHEDQLQGKINELSRRGRGDLDEAKARAVRSAFGGRFTLDESVLSLSRFAFTIPGATVQLQGRYGLTSERIDFTGRVLTQARVSQMTTGFKSVLLKAVDPLFRRDGAGASFPISIGGTRDKPQMKVDVRRALLRRD